MNYVRKKLWLNFLTCLVVLTETEMYLCFASFGNLTELECLPSRHLLKASKDLTTKPPGARDSRWGKQQSDQKPRKEEAEEEDT